MDIRFCDITKESIPDGEFEAGRAIKVGDRSYYVSAAMQRLMARSRVRGWLTFLLVLYAAGVVTFLLVTEMRREEPDLNAVSTAQVEEMSRRDAVLQSTVTGVLTDRLDALKAGLRADLSESDLQRGALKNAATVVATRIDDQTERSADRFTGMDKRQSRLEEEINVVRSWLLKVQGSADELLRRHTAMETDMAARVAAAKAEPKGEPDVGTSLPTERDPAHDEQVTTWIERLKSKNNDLVFTATVKLADLKDLRATIPLMGVLAKHKDFYARLGAATALGTLQAVASVPTLVDALGDRDELVRTAANEALIAITGQNFSFVSDMSSNERRGVKRKYRTWFKKNELELRRKLGQEVEGSSDVPAK